MAIMITETGKIYLYIYFAYSCSTDCGTETGYECDNSEPTVCTEICGDGLDFGQYECDDGDLNSGDGCSSVCDKELGYECTGGTHSGPDTCV